MEWDYSKELLNAKRNKAYYKAILSYSEEEIKLLEEKIKKNDNTNKKQN